MSASSRSSHGRQCATSGAFGSRLLRRARLDHVGDPDVLADQPGLGQELAEQLARRGRRTAGPSSSSVAPGASPTNITAPPGSLPRGPSATRSRTARSRSPCGRGSRHAVPRAGRRPCAAADLTPDLAHGVVVDSVNVSVLQYAPVRSASLA